MEWDDSQVLEHRLVQLDVLVSHGCCSSRGDKEKVGSGYVVVRPEAASSFLGVRAAAAHEGDRCIPCS